MEDLWLESALPTKSTENRPSSLSLGLQCVLERNETVSQVFKKTSLCVVVRTPSSDGNFCKLYWRSVISVRTLSEDFSQF